MEDSMNIREVVEKRRSIREFHDKEVPQQVLEEILELGGKAPSGKNRQPWRFVVLQGKEKEKLAEIMTGVIHLRKQHYLDIGSCEISIRAIQQAAVVILTFNAFSNFEKDYNHYRLLMDTQSIGAAIQTMILAAQDFGVGTLWICDIFHADREICSWLQRSDELVAGLALGYANQLPYPRPRRAWQELTVWEK